MKRHAFLLLGVLFVLWVGCGFGDEISPAENMIQAAALPTRAVGSIAAIGDSITAAFNAAHSEFESCEYRDTPAYNFATNKVRNTTVSIAERAIAYKGDGVAIANFGQTGPECPTEMTRRRPLKPGYEAGHSSACDCSSGSQRYLLGYKRQVYLFARVPTGIRSITAAPLPKPTSSRCARCSMCLSLSRISKSSSSTPSGLATLQLQGRKGHRCTMDFKNCMTVGCTHGHLPCGWCMSVTDRLHGRPQC